MRVTDTFDAFNGGEYSPLLEGQTGWDKYKLGCRELLNFIPRVQGPVEKPLGTRFVQPAKDTTQDFRLIPFVFGEADALMLEFGVGTIRFYKDRASVLSGGIPYEVATPYAAADLFRLQYEQRGDLLILTCFGQQIPQKVLTRLADDNWTLADIPFLSGPVVDGADGEAVTMQYTDAGTNPHGQAGNTVAMTASAAAFGTGQLGFQDGHIGSLWAFGEASGGLSPYGEWKPGDPAVTNDYYRYSGRLYLALDTGTFGTFAPQHTTGTVSDGTIRLRFINYGIGYATMTARADAQHASFLVQRQLPPTMETGSPNIAASAYWNESQWSKVRGFPGAVAFHEQRLCFGGTPYSPLSMNLSRTNRRFYDHDPGLETDADAIYNEIDGEFNQVFWAKSDGNFLLLGGFGGLAHYGNSLQQLPLTPGNVKAKSGGSRGVSYVTPVRTEDGIKCLSRDRKTLLLAQYSSEKEQYVAKSMNVKNPEVTGTGITQLAYQEAPQKMVWATRDDGQLLFLSEEGGEEVLAWGRRVTGLNADGTFGRIFTVAVMPGIEGDEVWLGMERTVGSATSRYIEYIEPTIQGVQQWWYVDSGIEYTGAPVTAIGGLDHLEGREVAILADGRALKNRSVNGGQVTFTAAVSHAVIGLPIVSRIRPMLVEGGSPDGPSQTKLKNIRKLAVRLYRTMGLKMGPAENNLLEVAFDEDQQRDAAGNPQLFGDPKPKDMIEGFDGDYSMGEICLQHDWPLPCTIVSISPYFVTSDKD